jgi:hypothetical protein
MKNMIFLVFGMTGRRWKRQFSDQLIVAIVLNREAAQE